jgi:endonuclease/exonuclease/phosphatase family metal-dependent hydrolase
MNLSNEEYFLKYKNDYLKLKYNQIGSGKGKNFSVVTYNVFGTIEAGKYINERVDHIVSEIFSKGSPDVICLQEATKIVIDKIIEKYPEYKKWTKLEVIDQETITPDELREVEDDGYITILSKHEYTDKELVYKGSYFDDGIMRVDIQIHDMPITIYNVHASGGTFGKKEEVVKKKQINRINELSLLNTNLFKTINSGKKDIIVMGDFNYDSNDLNHYIEGNVSPEYIFDNYNNLKCKDIWPMLKKNKRGATEDEIINTFRSAMKIKDKKDKRQCRYDKIIGIMDNINPIKIELIGNSPIDEEKVEVDGKNEKGIRFTTKTNLFPSDHFGLHCEFEITSID